MNAFHHQLYHFFFGTPPQVLILPDDDLVEYLRRLFSDSDNVFIPAVAYCCYYPYLHRRVYGMYKFADRLYAMRVVCIVEHDREVAELEHVHSSGGHGRIGYECLQRDTNIVLLE